MVEQSVLVLNSSGEVLDVRPWHRAVKLITKNKAREVGHEEFYEFKTPDGIVKMSSVLMLTYYVRVPHQKVAVTKENVLRRDFYSCGYCGKKLTNSTGTIDHVMPQSRGGKHTWANVVAACVTCNNKKDNKTPDEAGMKLLCKPYVPRRDAMMLTTIGSKHKSWERWIIT